MCVYKYHNIKLVFIKPENTKKDFFQQGVVNLFLFMKHLAAQCSKTQKQTLSLSTNPITTTRDHRNIGSTYPWLLGLLWLLGPPGRHPWALAALNLAHSYVTVHFKMLPVLCFSRHVAQTAALRQFY